MSETEKRKYTTLAFGTDDIVNRPKMAELEKEDDFEKLRKEFGVSFDPGPNRPRIFLNSNPEDDEDFRFLDFDDDEESNEHERSTSAFLDNIRVGAAINQTTARGLAIIGLLVVGYILVRCIQKIVE